MIPTCSKAIITEHKSKFVNFHRQWHLLKSWSGVLPRYLSKYGRGSTVWLWAICDAAARVTSLYEWYILKLEEIDFLFSLLLTTSLSFFLSFFLSIFLSLSLSLPSLSPSQFLPLHTIILSLPLPLFLFSIFLLAIFLSLFHITEIFSIDQTSNLQTNQYIITSHTKWWQFKQMLCFTVGVID